MTNISSDGAMDDPSINHYEQQLYSMFKSFDVNNEESLDESAVKNLCDALQLEERGAALVDTLFERRTGRVTFAQFRNGLLAVLGEERAPPEPPPASIDEESTSSDPAPRLVFGSKKYGRRSRPQESGAEGGAPRALSASRAAPELPPRPRRSASLMERRHPPALDHDTRISRDDALALCRSLRMQTIDTRLVDRIFEDSPTPDTTVGEFFDRLNSSLASSMEESGEASAGEGDAEQELAASAVAETWESVGVRRPRRLLADLGFVGPTVRPGDLERALDEELRAFEEPAEGRAALLAAALAVSRLRAAAAERRRRTAAAERDKLRADVAEANERARLLALEVDESHGRIENELRASVRRAEARLAEEAARAAQERAAERAQAAEEAARLRAEASRRADAEARLRAQLEEERDRARAAEERARAAEERAAAGERAAAEAGARLRAAEEGAARADRAERAAAAAEARAASLQAEAARHRDRADELAAALDARPAPPAHTPHPAHLSAELGSLLATEQTQENRVSAEVTSDGPSQHEIVPDNPSLDGVSLDDPSQDEEKVKLMELVKVLEGSLEAMRLEYESCEEYWAGKVAAERAAHEAEARAAADRLADLVARIAHFETRLALPTIPEAAALEAQVAHLEAEFAQYRRLAHRRAAALAARCERAERRPPPAPAPAPAPALAARCARAEAAARRLAARLRAADVLVKELYVENCHLAHARPLHI